MRVHVRSPRGAPNVRLAVDAAIEEVSVSVPDRGEASIEMDGPFDGEWAGDIRFVDVPEEGVEFTLKLAEPGSPAVAAFDESHGLEDLPGYRPRPDDMTASSWATSDVVPVGAVVRP